MINDNKYYVGELTNGLKEKANNVDVMILNQFMNE